MTQSLITQTQIQPVQFALNEAAANLAAHANASLSKAHGWQLIQFDPGSVSDSNGNDISVYYDNYGDVIGTAFLVFTLNGTTYYAPANPTALAGQPPNEGQAAYAGLDATTASDGIAEATWVTDVISGNVNVIDAVNTLSLLPHTQLAYWEVHGNVTINTTPVYDSIGHQISPARARLIFGGGTYEIPCTTRLGGMLIPPRLLGMNPSSASHHTEGSSGDYLVFSVPIVAGGSAPITFSYDYRNNSGDWIPFSAGTESVPTKVPNESGDNDFDVVYLTNGNGQLHVKNSGGGGGSMHLRCNATNAAGTVNTIFGTNTDCVFTFIFTHTSACWFCTEASRYRPVTPEQWATLKRIGRPIFLKNPRSVALYHTHGKQLVEHMRATGVPGSFFVNFCDQVLRLAADDNQAAADYFCAEVADACAKYWPDASLDIQAGCAAATAKHSIGCRS